MMRSDHVLSPLKTRSEWLVAAGGTLVVVALFIVDLLAGTRLFVRYWPLLGVLFGLGFLVTHRVVAPEEW